MLNSTDQLRSNSVAGSNVNLLRREDLKGLVGTAGITALGLPQCSNLGRTLFTKALKYCRTQIFLSLTLRTKQYSSTKSHKREQTTKSKLQQWLNKVEFFCINANDQLKHKGIISSSYCLDSESWTVFQTPKIVLQFLKINLFIFSRKTEILKKKPHLMLSNVISFNDS